MNKNKFYITTAIDYVNDTIHLGHSFQKIVADVFARYYRLKLGEENVFFLTGTDEYGKKAEQAAKEAGLATVDFVRKISDSDHREQDSLNISYNRFIRTTDADHAKVVQEIWRRAEKKGDIYLGEYRGLYCEGCEAYYSEADLQNGKCPFHPNLEIRSVEEKNYFFRWKKYKDFLISHIRNNPDFIFPRHRAQEMIEFARELADIPISRSNFSWGIPVPSDPSQVVYVWFDALTNYLTGVGFLENKELFEKFWPADVHILGKDNLRWHALLWPAMLASSELDLPKTILVNGFLTINGQKISKSLGNVIRPSEWVNKYGADAVRYYLLRYTSLVDDSDIAEDKLVSAYNSDLANGLGNLAARIARLCEGRKIKVGGALGFDEKVEKAIGEYKLNSALERIWEIIRDLDQRINSDKPWRISDEETLSKKLSFYVEKIRFIGFNLLPFIPTTAQQVIDQFSKSNITYTTQLFKRIR